MASVGRLGGDGKAGAHVTLNAVDATVFAIPYERTANLEVNLIV